MKSVPNDGTGFFYVQKIPPAVRYQKSKRSFIMNTRLLLQYGLTCLQVLDRESPHCLTVSTLSRAEGIPPTQCQEVLDRLTEAGLVEQLAAGFRLAKPIEEIT